MDPHIRSAIALIEVKDASGIASRGTGCLVAEGLVLTAFHVVGDREADLAGALYEGEIILTFPGHTTRATLHETYCDQKADWALLKCEQKPAVRPVPLGGLETEVMQTGGMLWKTYGFPDANPGGMEMDGDVTGLDELESSAALQLFCKHAAAGQGAPVRGLSGGPVIVDGALVGVMRFALMEEKGGIAIAGTLYACPVPSVVQFCGDLLPLVDPCYGLPGLPRYPPPHRPFRYLDSYAEEHAEIFFGRNEQIGELYRKLTKPDQDTHPVTLLYGQSGVGKSSLLAAGLVPRLRLGHQVKCLVRDPARSLTELLLSELAPVAESPGKSSELAARWLATEERTGQPLIVLLDQIERVFTLPCATAPDDLAEFAAALKEIFSGERKSQGHLVFAFRKEWLPDMQKVLDDAGVDCGELFLESLDQRGIVEVVNGLKSTPRLIDAYHLRVDDEVPLRIALHLLADHNSPVAPALQILLTKMWSKVEDADQGARRFTVKLWEELQAKGLGYDDFLKQQLETLASSENKALAKCVESGLALDILYYHTTESLTGQQRLMSDTTDDYSQRSDVLPELIENLKRLFLLSSARESKDEATRLSHDTLARVVRKSAERSDWIGQRARRILEARAAAWDGSDVDALESPALAVFEKGREGMRNPTPEESKLIEASYRNRSSTLRRKRVMMAAGALAVSLITTAAIVASVFYFRSERQLELATLRYQAAQSQNEWLDVMPFRAMIQAIAVAGESLASRQGKVIPEAQAAVFAALAKATEINVIPDFEAIPSIAVTHDGRIAIGEDPSDTTVPSNVGFWNTDGAKVNDLTPVTVSDGFSWDYAGTTAGPIVFSPDGELLAIGTTKGIRMGTSAGRNVKTVGDGKEDAVLALAFSADSNFLFSGDKDGWLRAWKRDGTQIDAIRPSSEKGPVKKGLPDLRAINALSAARGANSEMLLASGGSDKIVHLWEFDGHKFKERTKWTTDDVVNCLHLKPYQLAAGSADGLVHIWTYANDTWTESATPPYNAQSPVQSIAFTNDGKFLAAGGMDGAIHFVSHRGNEIGAPFQGIATSVRGLVFRERNVLIAAGEHSVHFLDVGHLSGAKWTAVTTAFEGQEINGVGVLAGGKFVVGVDSGVASFWADSGGIPKKTYPGGDLFDALVASPDGSMFAGVHRDGKVTLFDAAGSSKGKNLGDIELESYTLDDPPDDPYPQVVFFPDSQRLAVPDSQRLAVGFDGKIGIWSITAHEPEPPIESPRGAFAVFTIVQDEKGPLIVAALKPTAGRRDSTVEFWRLSGHLDEGHESISVDLHPTAIALRPDGKGFVIGASSGGVQCYMFKGKKAEKLGGVFQVGKKEIRWLQVDKKSERIFAANLDGTVEGLFYPVESRSRKVDQAQREGQAFAQFRFGYEFGGAALSADESVLVVGGKSALIVFHADWPSALRADCERVKAHRCFTGSVCDDATIVARAQKVCAAEPWKRFSAEVSKEAKSGR